MNDNKKLKKNILIIHAATKTHKIEVTATNKKNYHLAFRLFYKYIEFCDNIML